MVDKTVDERLAELEKAHNEAIIQKAKDEDMKAQIKAHQASKEIEGPFKFLKDLRTTISGYLTSLGPFIAYIGYTEEVEIIVNLIDNFAGQAAGAWIAMGAVVQYFRNRA